MIPTVLRRSLPVLVAAVALILASCASGSSSTPAASSGGNGQPPSDCAKVENGVINLSAKDLEFSAPCMVANAGEAFSIHFTNEDAQPHNVAVYTDSSASTKIMGGDIISTKGESMDYQVEAQDEGEYYFNCEVHPDMNGTLYVVAA